MSAEVAVRLAEIRRREDLVLLAVSAGIILLAALLTPGGEAVSLLGVEIPATCASKVFLDFECPGCGLTRSFTYMGNAQPVEAFRMHKLGPALFLLVAGQVPWRAWRLLRAR